MTPSVINAQKTLDGTGLKALAACGGPCITFLLPKFRPGAQSSPPAVHLKGLLRTAAQQLEKSKWRGSADELLSAVEQLAASPEMVLGGDGIAIFRAPGVLSAYRAPRALNERVAVASHFYVTPLLSDAFGPQEIYILALNRKRLRLLHYSGGECKEVTPPASVPLSLDAAVALDQPDHVLENRSAAGSSTGAMHAVHFGTGSDREAAGEYLHHFFGLVDRGLRKTLHGAPLLLAGVAEELAAYRRVAKYPNILADESHANASLLTAVEAAEFARQAALHQFQASGQKVLENFREMTARDRTATDIHEILRAATQGRVHQLVAADGAEWAENLESGGEDLINAAAVETLRTGGEVFLAPRERMEQTAPAVAILRY